MFIDAEASGFSTGGSAFLSHTAGSGRAESYIRNDTLYLPPVDTWRIALVQLGVDGQFGFSSPHFHLMVPVGLGWTGAYRSLDDESDGEGMGAFLFRVGVRTVAVAGPVAMIGQIMYDMCKTEFENELREKYDFSTGGLRVHAGLGLDIMGF